MPEMDPAAGTSLSQRQIQIVFVTILLGILLAALDSTIVSTMLAGKPGDLFGRKVVRQISTATFVVGSGQCGVAGTAVA